MNKRVIPFQIAIGSQLPGGAYGVLATCGHATTSTELRLPPALLAWARRLLQPGVLLPISRPFALGQALGQTLFVPPLRDMLLRSARAAAQSGSRLQLQLQIGAPEVAALPWEWLSIGNARPWLPALRDDYTLVRVGRAARPPRPAQVSGPLCILAAAGSSERGQLEALAAALDDLARAGRIDLRLLPDATPSTLEAMLAREPVQILHLAAPIAFTPRGVRLAIRSGLDSFDLAAMLAEAPALRLVTLTGVRGDAETISVAAPLLAAMLLGERLPATIAFGGALPAVLAAHFSAACYAALAAGDPLDLAVTAGRRALMDEDQGHSWGMPQIRLVPGAERLFALKSPRAHARSRVALPAAGAAAALLAAALLIGRAPAAPGEPTPSPTIRNRTQFVTLATPTPRSTVAPTAVPSPTPLPSMTATARPEPASYTTLIIAADDTLESIATRMGSDASAIAQLNRLNAQAPLRAERLLLIPLFQANAPPVNGAIVARGNPTTPKIALTFDIEIDDATLYAILETLRSRNIHATFFVTGRWTQRYPDAARAIVAGGHEVGNHSLTHPFFTRIGLDGAVAEIEQTEQIVRETTGQSTRPYFRFPYGASTPDAAAVAARHGYLAFHWTADDAAIPGWLATVADNPARGYGAILLMHGRKSTAEALPGWLDQLAAIGLQPTTLGDTLR